jgi:trans-2,3-dihydro-3-hydroxyanthranilate isomerase
MRDGLRYRVVDVFTERALEGNALAVFPVGAAVPESLMQAIARELNLSETVFVLPSAREDCATRLRIFTPSHEMKFAGHPTVGTAWVLLDEGMVARGTERFQVEEGVGPVPLRVDAEGLIWLTTPAIAYGRTYDADACAEALGLARGDLLEVAPQWVSAGNPTIFVALKDREAVDRAQLEVAGLRRMIASGKGDGVDGADSETAGACVFVFAPVETGAYSRMFAPELGIVEDPATGSSTGPLASFMMRHGLVAGGAGARWVSEQGKKMGRRSLLHVHVTAEGGIEVGGNVAPVGAGVLHL